MCVFIALITPEPCEARAFTSDEGATFTTGQSATNTARRRCSTERPASRLIAVFRLDNGFPLMLGADGPDFRLYKRQNPYYIPLISGCAKTTGGWRNQSY